MSVAARCGGRADLACAAAGRTAEAVQRAVILVWDVQLAAMPRTGALSEVAVRKASGVRVGASHIAMAAPRLFSSLLADPGCWTSETSG
jgi:hypothetical protein